MASFIFQRHTSNPPKDNIMTKEIATKTTNGALYNALIAGSKIIGTIIADGDFRIDGTVEGDINSKSKVIIGQSGFIKGTIQCVNAEIFGSFDGKLDIKETLTVHATANIIGEIKTKILVVEPNAIINGTCSMTDDKTNKNKHTTTDKN